MSGDWIDSTARSPTIYSSPISTPTPSPTVIADDDHDRVTGTTSIPANEVSYKLFCIKIALVKK